MLSGIDYSHENPEKVLQSFKKAFALYDEFKTACLSYSGGAEYFQKDGFRFRESVQHDLNVYMKYDYEEALALNFCNCSAPRINSINPIGKLAFQADLLNLYGADKRRSRSDRPT